MTYLRKVLALAGQSAPTVSDVNEPLADSDTSQENPLLQLKDAGPLTFSEKAQQQLDEMTALNKLKVHSYITSGKAALSAGRPVQASEQFIRAAAGAKIAGAHCASHELWQYVRSLAEQSNATPKEN